MPRPTKYRINLLDSEREVLEKLIAGRSTGQQLATRARIVLLANGDWLSNQAIAEKLGIRKADVTLWTQRWLDRAGEPVEDRLADLARCGRPATIDEKQWCQIHALACEPPQEYGRPISHWSSWELAEEAVKQGIVENLSAGHLRKVLKKRHCNRTALATG